MPQIYIARHGQDEDNAKGILNGHRDKALTDAGEKQARDLAETIKENNILVNKLYTAPLRRTFRTAEILAEELSLEKPEIMDLLIERDFGEMSGKSVNEIEKLCAPDILKTEYITYFLNPKNGENFPQLLQRAEKVLLNINQEEGNILLVTSGDIGKMIYAAYYKLDYLEALKSFHFGNSDLLLLSRETKSDEVHIFRNKQYNP